MPGNNGVAVVDVTITAPASPNQGQYGGYITLTPQGGGNALSVPYAGFIGDYQTVPVLTPTANGFPWLARLNAAVNAAIIAPQTRERLAALGSEGGGGTPEEFGALIRKDSAMWADVVKRSGAKID